MSTLYELIETNTASQVDFSRLSSDDLLKLIRMAGKLQHMAEFAEIEAIHRLQSGDEIPGASVKFGLVRRSWNKAIPEQEIAGRLINLGVSDPWQMKKTLRSIADIDKEIGQNKYGDLIECNQNKHTLVLKEK